MEGGASRRLGKSENTWRHRWYCVASGQRERERKRERERECVCVCRVRTRTVVSKDAAVSSNGYYTYSVYYIHHRERVSKDVAVSSNGYCTYSL